VRGRENSTDFPSYSIFLSYPEDEQDTYYLAAVESILDFLLKSKKPPSLIIYIYIIHKGAFLNDKENKKCLEIYVKGYIIKEQI